MIPVFQPEFSDEEHTLLREVIDSGRLTEGPKTQEFESLLKDYLKVDYVVVLPSGGVSLYLALLAVGVRRDDEVLCPDYCHISLPYAVKMIGARPFFIDIDFNDGCLRWKDLPELCKWRKEKCLTTVDMNGRYCDYDALVDITCNKFPIIQDHCQSLASAYEGEHLFSSIGCLSFHSTKIAAVGNGGAVFTNDVDLYREVKTMKDYGRFIDSRFINRSKVGEISDYNESWGFNFRVTEMESAVGIAQMHRLDKQIMRNREIYRHYVNGLKPKLVPSFHVGHIHWVFDISLPPRMVTKEGKPTMIYPNQMMKRELALRDIETRLPYVPMHHQPLYRFGKDFVGSDTWSNSCLWLPSSPSLSDEEITYVIKNVNQVYEQIMEE